MTRRPPLARQPLCLARSGARNCVCHQHQPARSSCWSLSLSCCRSGVCVSCDCACVQIAQKASVTRVKLAILIHWFRQSDFIVSPPLTEQGTRCHGRRKLSLLSVRTALLVPLAFACKLQSGALSGSCPKSCT